MICATCRKGNSCPLHEPGGELGRPERLVGIGFRCWLAGYDTGSVEAWECGWDIYRDAVGDGPARRLVGELSCWARDVHGTARRRLSYYPFLHAVDASRFSDDEMLGVRLICAAQAGARAEEDRFAEALTGRRGNTRVTASARSFAEALTDTGLTLFAMDDNLLVISGAAEQEMHPR